MRNSFNQLLVALAIFDTTYLVSDACIFWKFQSRMSSLICTFVLGNEHRKVNQDKVSGHLQHHQTYDTEDPLPPYEHLDDSICLSNRYPPRIIHPFLLFDLFLSNGNFAFFQWP